MFRIVITKEDEKDVIEQKWQQLYADQDTAAANGAKHTHGYVDKKSRVVQETQLLDQRVENLNLEAVILAVNNIVVGPSKFAEAIMEGNLPPHNRKDRKNAPDNT